MYDTLKMESKMNEFCIESECCVQNGGPIKKNNMISFRLQYANEIKARSQLNSHLSKRELVSAVQLHCLLELKGWWCRRRWWWWQWWWWWWVQRRWWQWWWLQ